MKNIALSIVLALISLQSAIAQKAPEYLWGKNMGGTDIAISKSGHLYNIRSFSDTIVHGGQTFISRGLSDAILIKSTIDGNIIWQRHIGGKFTDYVTKVRCDNSGNVYVLGDFQYKIIIGADTLTGKGYRSALIAKIDSGGNFLWSQSIDYLGDNVWNSISIDNFGNIYAGVHANIIPNDTLQIGNNYFTGRGSNDIFIAKYSSSGQVVWALQEGGVNRDGILSIAVDNSGSIYATGFFSDSAYFGNTLFADASISDIFLAKYDSTGILQFVVIPQQGNGMAFDMAVDSSGYIYQCGQINNNAIFGGTPLFVSTTSSFLTKYDKDGNVIWAKNYPYNKHHHGFRMYLDHNNDIYVNMVYGVASIVKYSNNGDIIWSNEYGPQQIAPSVMGLCADNNWNLYFTGTCDNHNNIFGRDTIALINGNSSQFIAKAGPFPSGISKQVATAPDISLYPNPNTGNFVISSSNLGQYTTYEIVAATGQSIAAGKLQLAGNSAEINTGALAAGVYILRLNGLGGISSLKFVVE